MTRFLSTSRFIVLAAIFGLLVFALAGTVFAQTETGTVTGTVTDPTGAVVANAKVSATNVANGGVRVTQTNERGEYAITNLQPGTYNILVEAPNFSKAQTRIVVTVGSKVGNDFRLAVGNAASTTVEVIASGTASVNVETQTLSESAFHAGDTFKDGTVRFDFVDAMHVRLRPDSGASAPTQMPRP